MPSEEKSNDLKYDRIVLKISGESLQGKKGYGLDPSLLTNFATEIKELNQKGLEISIVVGGGNIFRGLQGTELGFDRVSGDYMGMLATVINALALQEILEGYNLTTRVLTAIHMEELAEPYIRRRAIRHLEKSRIVIFGAGTGNPYFTTDTAASLRAVEIGADIILKGTKVEGIYSEDPKENEDAVKYDTISFIDVLNKGLKIMDATSISLCRDNDIPVIVYKFFNKGDLTRIVRGEQIGTLVKKEI